jgi:hypothetical protein
LVELGLLESKELHKQCVCADHLFPVRGYNL